MATMLAQSKQFDGFVPDDIKANEQGKPRALILVDRQNLLTAKSNGGTDL